MEPRSVRLNYGNRQTFITTVLEKLMPQTGRPNTQTFYKANEKTIYEYVYGSCKELLSQLPSWAVVKTKSIAVMLGKEEMYFTLAKEELAFEDGKYCSDGDIFRPIRTFDEYDPLTLAYKAAQQQSTDWVTKRTALRIELTKVVNACNTSAQLYQAWPKSLEFAHLFPYKGSKTTPKLKVDSAVLDMTLQISKSTVVPPEEN